MGEEYGRTGPAPYNIQTQTYFDANRNVVRVETQDLAPQFTSDDPTDARYAQLTLSGNGVTSANLALVPGAGGSLRPGWFSNLYTYDLLDDKIQEDVDATGSNPASLVTGYRYDPNQNLITTIKPNGNLEEYDYDERDLQIAVRIGYDAATGNPGAVTVNVYDPNEQLIETIGPAQRGAAGNSQTVTIGDAFSSGSPLTHTGDYTAANTLDGFDRVITVTDAVGGVTTRHFDPASNLISADTAGVAGGATPTDRTGSGNVELSLVTANFDEASRQYETQQDVRLNTLSGNSLPSGRTATHTGGGLQSNSTTNGNTGTVTLTAGGASYTLQRVVFDRNDRQVAVATDNGALAFNQFDGAGRDILSTDALGNTVATTLDNNGNAVVVVRTENGTITQPAQAAESFTTINKFDCMDQLVFTAQNGPDNSISSQPGVNLARITFNGFDSRGNNTISIDANGNGTLFTFDGASRNTEQRQLMRQDGQGDNPPLSGNPGSNGNFLTSGQGQLTGSVLTTFQFDGNGNTTALVDDRGGTTLYDFDTLDRQTAMTLHDGSTYKSVYNLASDVVTYTDANGTVANKSWDCMGRNTSNAITPAAGVGGTTGQAFQYDGLSRITQTTDTKAAGTDTTNHYYDTLSRTVEGQQALASGGSGFFTNTAFTSLPATQQTYPSNRTVNGSFDVLYRKAGITEGATGASIASWQYFGPGRVAEVALGNGIIQSMLNNARTHSAVQGTVPNPPWGTPSSDRLGYDGAGRMIAKRYLAGGINGSTFAYNNTNPVVGNTTGYDPADNKFYERALHAENTSSLYQPVSLAGQPGGGYDSMNRLLQYQRGTLDSTGGYLGDGGGSVTSPITLPKTNQSEDWTLDGFGNWRAFTVRAAQACSAISYRRNHNRLNQITQQSYGPYITPFLYDGKAGASNGNLINDGTLEYQFDGLNRLVLVVRLSDGKPIGTYRYDALNRRTNKTITNGGLSGNIPDSSTDYYYNDGWQCMEERIAGTATAVRQYVWGNYIDECVQLTTHSTLGPQNLPAGAYYPLQDLLYRTVALTNSTGGIVEAYDTDTYGNTLIITAPDSGGNWLSAGATQSTYGANEIIFCGYRFDPETQAYHVRMRMYNSILGRWLQRDPIWYPDGWNLYEYAGGLGPSTADPEGLSYVKVLGPDGPLWSPSRGGCVIFFQRFTVPSWYNCFGGCETTERDVYYPYNMTGLTKRQCRPGLPGACLSPVDRAILKQALFWATYRETLLGVIRRYEMAELEDQFLGAAAATAAGACCPGLGVPTAIGGAKTLKGLYGTGKMLKRLTPGRKKGDGR